MPIMYRELRPDDDFGPCLDLQRRVFGFSDVDLTSPHILRMLARNDPPMGLAVGVFDEEEGRSAMVGFIFGFATLEEGCIYTALMGIAPERQGSSLGFRLMVAYRDIAVAKGLRSMRFVHEPLDPILGRLYYRGFGCRAYRYMTDRSDSSPPADKLLTVCDFMAPGFLGEKVGSGEGKLGDLLGSVRQAGRGSRPEEDRVLMEIPGEFIGARAADRARAHDLRLETREVLDEYLNARGYQITDCITGRVGETRRSFYLLERGRADAAPAGLNIG